MRSLFTLSMFLTAAYIAAVVGLNLITYLISDFYRKKFDQPAPRLGFLLAIIMGITAAVLMLFQSISPTAIKVTGSFLLLCASGLSIYSTISLHITMKRIRK